MKRTMNQCSQGSNMMYSVRPRTDGQDFQGSWMVHKGNKMKTNHTTKEAAINEAYRRANKGDTLRIHRQDGTIQDTRTVRGGSDGQEETQSAGIPGLGGGYGKGTFEEGVSNFFE